MKQNTNTRKALLAFFFLSLFSLFSTSAWANGAFEAKLSNPTGYSGALSGVKLFVHDSFGALISTCSPISTVNFDGAYVDFDCAESNVDWTSAYTIDFTSDQLSDTFYVDVVNGSYLDMETVSGGVMGYFERPGTEPDPQW